MLRLQPLNNYQLASEAHIEELALLKRFDTKFVLNLSHFDDLLDRLQSDYHLLTANNAPWDTYTTHYFDTSQFDFYEQHRRGIRPRFKVRVRSYEKRDRHYLEVKEKNKYDQLIKTRHALDTATPVLTQSLIERLPQELQNIDLESKLTTVFKRIMLLSKDNKERVSIDWDLKFSNHLGMRSFEHIAIVEIKQARPDRQSPAWLAFKDLFCHPVSMSKYCHGLIALELPLKNHVFRPTMRMIQKQEQSHPGVHLL